MAKDNNDHRGALEVPPGQSNPGAMIEFRDVTRTYGDRVAVDGLTLTVPAGELFAMLGPNGAGKTTTIKMLVGLLRPTSGTVCVDGCDVVRYPREAARCVGYVPDEPFLYDKLSGREFLEFVAEMRGLDRRTRAARIEREVVSFGLAGFFDDLTETYSHGMKQRLVFASALLHDPRVLVIDEPMVGLDPRSVRMVKDMLCARARAGAAVFMSTHILSMAEEIGGRLCIVDRGRVNFLGTLSALQQELALPHTSLEPLFLKLTANGDGDRTLNGTGFAGTAELTEGP
jgi:ABC-2 type transport system ATP-binding protein